MTTEPEGTAAGDHAEAKRVMLDDWDEPEFDDTDSKRKNEKGPSDDNPSKKSKGSPPKNPSDEGPGGSSSSSPTKEMEYEAADSADGTPKRRRSFCSFVYSTTQGGSSNVEPGDDPTLQSPKTNTKALKLVEFAHDAQQKPEVPKIDL